jgi:stalled ribosome rescue protein Dom34
MKISKTVKHLEIESEGSHTDLWNLSKLIEEGDIVEMMTLRRKNPPHPHNEMKKKIEKVPMLLRIRAERIVLDHQQAGDRLRVIGTIIGEEGSGDHHTMHIVEGRRQSLLLEKLHETARFEHYLAIAQEFRKQGEVFVLSLSRDHAVMTKLRDRTIAVLGEAIRSTSGKLGRVERDIAFEDQVLRLLEPVTKEGVIICGLGFYKQDFLKKRTPPCTVLGIVDTQNEGLAGIEEMLSLRTSNNPTIDSMMMSKHLELIEEILAIIGGKNTRKDAEYGKHRVLESLDRVEAIITSEEFVQDSENEPLIREILARSVDLSIVDCQSRAGKLVNGLGGIASLLLYRA